MPASTRNSVYDTSDAVPLIGEAFTIAPMPIHSMTKPEKTIVAVGEIVDIEIRDRKVKGKYPVEISITDYEGSVMVRTAIGENEIESYKALFPGMSVAVFGALRYDTDFDGELVINPVSISKIQKIERMDTAPEKRVELHLRHRGIFHPRHGTGEHRRSPFQTGGRFEIRPRLPRLRDEKIEQREVHGGRPGKSHRERAQKTSRCREQNQSHRAATARFVIQNTKFIEKECGAMPHFFFKNLTVSFPPRPPAPTPGRPRQCSARSCSHGRPPLSRPPHTGQVAPWPPPISPPRHRPKRRDSNI